MAEGKWSGRANRHTVLNGDGEPTEKGWNLIETTGVTLKMLLSVHVQGRPLSACKSCWEKVQNWKVKYNDFQAKYGFLRLDVENLPARRDRNRLSTGHQARVHVLDETGRNSTKEISYMITNPQHVEIIKHFVAHAKAVKKNQPNDLARCADTMFTPDTVLRSALLRKVESTITAELERYSARQDPQPVLQTNKDVIGMVMNWSWDRLEGDLQESFPITMRLISALVPRLRRERQSQGLAIPIDGKSKGKLIGS